MYHFDNTERGDVGERRKGTPFHRNDMNWRKEERDLEVKVFW